MGDALGLIETKGLVACIEAADAMCKSANVELISYVALPEDASDDHPVAGILVAPEWWGVVDHPKSVVERLAEAGYAAVAMDVYGEGKLTTDAAQANMWMEQVLADQDMLMAII